MAADSTPGIWQNERYVIVLAHVVYCAWFTGSEERARDAAEHLNVYMVTKSIELYATEASTPDARKAARLAMGDDFVRALNMYWETNALEQAARAKK